MKKIKNIRSSALSRGLSLASLGLKAGAKAAASGATEIFLSDTAKKIKEKAYLISQMALLADELGKLKGSVMKVGQMLSVYGEHFLPPEANQLLKQLHNSSPPVEWREMEKQITRAMGKELRAQLEVEEECLAAASLGQVHKAYNKKTKEVYALKIQYPGVDNAIEGDIKALKTLLQLAKILPQLPNTDLIFDEIKTMLKQELDYNIERENLLCFHALLKNDPRYVLPKVYPEFSNRRVLAMSYEPGIKVDSEKVLSLSQSRRNQLATNFLELYFQELYEWRKVQTDPHFGNYQVRLQENKKDQLILFDYGAVREFSHDFIRKHRMMLKGILLQDRSLFEKGARELKMLEDSDSQELKDIFYELCSLILKPFATEGLYQWGADKKLPQTVSELGLKMLKNFPLREPPREIVFLDRKMVGVYTFLTKLEAEIDSRALLLSHLERTEHLYAEEKVKK